MNNEIVISQVVINDEDIFNDLQMIKKEIELLQKNREPQTYFKITDFAIGITK